MRALLLETATEICSVALAQDRKIISERIADGPHQHASKLNVFIDDLLRANHWEAAALTHLGLSEGPGSYTSLRVGAALAKGLCLALPQLSLYPLSSLQALGLQAFQRGAKAVIATQESRRNEVYALLLDGPDQSSTAAKALAVDDPVFTDFCTRHPELTIVGSGTEKLAAAIGRPTDRLLPELQNQAAYLLPQLQAVIAADLAPANLATFEPLYLKPPFVTVPKKRSLL
ncbi:MAG: tRNA (adenosine(37)-N6)-threonylcarbamoyltransferase complex dimerization subunit type 1 TsaB [Bacteroidota bacterium]